MKKANEGVSLAAIVAKEITTGKCFDLLTGHEVLAEPLYITKLIDELAQISK